MEYIGVKEAAARWGLTARMVNDRCANGRIEGTRKIAGARLLPRDAARPEDRRKGKGNGRRPASKNEKEEG